MIIKEIRIRNFRSYYGDENVFSLSNGLTLILGDNGDGKTTFFEALEWLFSTTNDYRSNSLENVSEMRKSEMSDGDEDFVSVYMTFEHEGEKSVEKILTFSCNGDNAFKAGQVVYKGYVTEGSERIAVDGRGLINKYYDSFIQRFSMFKGESNLNVFNDATALKQLVDKFSDIKQFDKLVEYSESFAGKSDAAYRKEMKSDEKVSTEAKALENQLSSLSEDIRRIKKNIEEQEKSIDSYTTRLNNLNKSRGTVDKYRDLTNRLKDKEERKLRLQGMIGGVNNNHSLLDSYWVLCAFSEILTEFRQKCAKLSKEKRKQDLDFERQKGIAKGKLEAIKEIQGELENGALKLPWYLPEPDILEEMLNDHICKVCGRPFEENDKAYTFILNKLNEYKEHTLKKARIKEEKLKIDESTLFKSEQVEALHNLSMALGGQNEAFVANIPKEISERQDFVEARKTDLGTVLNDINEIKDEISRLLIQAGGVSEDTMEKDWNDLSGLHEQKERAAIRLSELKSSLTGLQAQHHDVKVKFDSLKPQSSQVKVYRLVKDTLEAIAKAFADAKKENLRRFLSDMQDKANDYLEKLSVNDFHGEIRLTQTTNDSTRIKLYSSNGTEIKNPSGSQETVMYISILFAISDFTQENRDEDYPLIFDAATSSFGDMKEDDFYNVINKIRKQCIIVTKDFLTRGKVRMDEVNKLNCPVYRIKKSEGFDQNNLATIRTTVKKIKD